MKKTWLSSLVSCLRPGFLLLLLSVGLALHAPAQDADPLAVTLPNGKVVHFQSAEQKAKFEAASQRKVLAAPAPSTPTPTPVHHAQLGSSMDAPANGGTGIVNPSAPPFTASYYMMAPATWVGKKMTLAVAYVHERTDAARPDGMVELTASTWNSSVTSGGDQDSGGNMVIVATPKGATRLMQQCGASMQYLGWGRYKVTMIKGEMTELVSKGDKARYGFVVDE